MSARHAAGLHNPGHTAEYPFLGEYKVPKELAHGHSGISKTSAATNLALRITGNDVVVDSISLPASEELHCTFSESNGPVTRGVVSSNPVAFRYEGQLLTFPNNGKSYCLGLQVSKNRGAVKHNLKVHVQSREPGQQVYGALSGGCRLEIPDESLGKELVVRVAGEPLQHGGARSVLIPADTTVTLMRNAYHSGLHARLRSVSNSLLASIGGSSFRASPGEDAFVPLDLLATGDPLQIQSFADSEKQQVLPHIELGLDSDGKGHTVAVLSTNDCFRVELQGRGSRPDEVVTAEGKGICQVSFPEHFQVLRIRIITSNGTEILSQNIVLPHVKKTAAAAVRPTLNIAVEEKDESRVVSSAGGEPAALVTEFTLDQSNTAEWRSFVDVVRPSTVLCRTRSTATGAIQDQATLAFTKAVDWSWLKDLNNALSESTSDSPTDPNDLQRRLSAIHSTSPLVNELLGHLQKLVQSKPELEIEGTLHSLRCVNQDIEASINGRLLVVAPGDAVPLPTTSAPVRLATLSRGTSRRHVTARLTLQSQPTSTMPNYMPGDVCWHFSAVAPNSLHGVSCSAASEIQLRLGDGSVRAVPLGTSVQANPGTTCVLQALDRNKNIIAQCQLHAADGQPQSSHAQDPTGGSEWDPAFINQLISALRAYQRQPELLRSALLSINPPTSQARDLRDALVDAFSQDVNDLRLTESPSTAGRVKVSFDGGATLRELAPSGIVVPRGTKNAVIDLVSSRDVTKPLNAADLPTILFDLRKTDILSGVTTDRPNEYTIVAQSAEYGRRHLKATDVYPDQPLAAGRTLLVHLSAVHQATGEVYSKTTVTLNGTADVGARDAALLLFDMARGSITNTRLFNLSTNTPMPGVQLVCQLDGYPQRAIYPGDNLPFPDNGQNYHSVTLTAIDTTSGAVLTATKINVIDVGSQSIASTGGSCKADISFKIQNSETVVDVLAPVGTTISCAANGDAPVTVGSHATLRLDAYSSHSLHIVIRDTRSQSTLLEQKIGVPRMLFPSFEFALDEQSISCTSSSGGLVTAVVDGRPEVTLHEPLLLSGDSSHSVHLKCFGAAFANGQMSHVKVTQLKLVMRPFIDSKELIEVIQTFQGPFEAVPATLSLIVKRLTHIAGLAKTTPIRQLASILADRIHQLMLALEMGNYHQLVIQALQQLSQRQTSQLVHFRLRGEEHLV